jgi:hypothetical protein
MSEEVRAAVFGNVGTMIVFRVGAFDAEVLEKEFFPTFTKEDLVNLGFVQCLFKLMIDGVTSQPFSATTLPPIEKPLISFKESIIETSRASFAHPRSEVEEMQFENGMNQSGLNPESATNSDQVVNPHAAGGTPQRSTKHDAPKDISNLPRREDKNQSRESKEMELRRAIAQNYPKAPRT